jgi:hypothetical protein
MPSQSCLAILDISRPNKTRSVNDQVLLNAPASQTRSVNDQVLLNAPASQTRSVNDQVLLNDLASQEVGEEEEEDALFDMGPPPAGLDWHFLTYNHDPVRWGASREGSPDPFWFSGLFAPDSYVRSEAHRGTMVPWVTVIQHGDLDHPKRLTKYHLSRMCPHVRRAKANVTDIILTQAMAGWNCWREGKSVDSLSLCSDCDQAATRHYRKVFNLEPATSAASSSGQGKRKASELG